MLSYNMLADSLAHEHRSKLYFHIPYHMMDWQWRKNNLIFELGLWSADIMCFQVHLSCFILCAIFHKILLILYNCSLLIPSNMVKLGAVVFEVS